MCLTSGSFLPAVRCGELAVSSKVIQRDTLIFQPQSDVSLQESMVIGKSGIYVRSVPVIGPNL